MNIITYILGKNQGKVNVVINDTTATYTDDGNGNITITEDQ